MSGNTSIVSATPGFVVGTYGAKPVRNSVMNLAAPGGGFVTRGDFGVTQNGAGAMNVNIAAGGAFVLPTAVTRQGPYYCQNDSSYNTNTNGGYTWTAADPTNPRIDLLCIEVKDNAEDASGSTGWRFRIIDGVAGAGATHQLEVGSWPAIPAGVLPIAAIRVPAAATTLTTTNITNLNPMCGLGQASVNYVAAVETTTGTAFGRLVSTAGTADFAMVYVPNGLSEVEVGYRALVLSAAAAGTHSFAMFINGTQWKIPVLRGVPIVHQYDVVPTLGTKYAQITTVNGSPVSATTGLLSVTPDSTTDETFETSPTVIAAPNATTGMSSVNLTGSYHRLAGLTAGWNVIELRYKASANTITGKNRTTVARVV